MSNIVIFILAIALTFPALGAERLRLIQPKAATLKVAKIDYSSGPVAEFKGRMWVTGTLVVKWGGEKSVEPEYLLIPDHQSRQRLPHFVRYGVTWIEVKNGVEALSMARGADFARRASEWQKETVKLTGAFEIDSYVVGVECDAPWARASVARVNIPKQQLAALSGPEGC